MVWNDYLTKPDGGPADLFIGQDGGDNVQQRNHIMDRSHHAVDDKDRLWAGSEHGKLMVYQLPFRRGREPLRDAGAALLGRRAGQGGRLTAPRAVAFDPVNRHSGSSTAPPAPARPQPRRLAGQAAGGCGDRAERQDRRARPTAGMEQARRRQLRRRQQHQLRPARATCSWWTTPTRGTQRPRPRVPGGGPEGTEGHVPGPSRRRRCTASSGSTRRSHRPELPAGGSPVLAGDRSPSASSNEMVIGNDGYYRDPKLRTGAATVPVPQAAGEGDAGRRHRAAARRRGRDAVRRGGQPDRAWTTPGTRCGSSTTTRDPAWLKPIR